MICQRCGKRPAEVQYTELIGGKKTMQWLCSQCARDAGLMVTLQLHSLSSGEAGELLAGDTASSPRCPDCGTEAESLRRSGLLGCPRCYEVFHAQLAPLLRSVHHATDHHPSGGADDPLSRLERVLQSLRRELSESVRREEFERAASIRDEIRRYEKERAELSSPPQPEGDEGE